MVGVSTGAVATISTAATKSSVLAALREYSKKNGKDAAYALMKKVGCADALRDVPTGKYQALIDACGLYDRMREVLRQYQRKNGDMAVAELVKSVTGQFIVKRDDIENLNAVIMAATSGVTVFTTIRRIREFRTRARVG